MLEITEALFDHTLPKDLLIDNSLIQAFYISGCESYGWENTSGFDAEAFEKGAKKEREKGAIFMPAKRLIYPLGLLYETGIKLKKYLIFLENENVPQEYHYIPAYKELDKIRKKVVEDEETFENFIASIKRVFKKAEENITFREAKKLKYLPALRGKLEALSELGSRTTQKHLDFVGVDHNFSKRASEVYTHDFNYNFRIYIPEVGEYQDELNIKILTSKAFYEGRGELAVSRYYAESIDSLFKNFGKKKIKKEFNRYFRKELEDLDKLKGRKVHHKQLEEILQRVNLNHFEEINHALERWLRNAIKIFKCGKADSKENL